MYYSDVLSIAEHSLFMQQASLTRIARITVPGVPHHVTQRGNRRQPISVEPEDHALYRDLTAR